MYVLLFVAFAAPAYAYIDPNAGGLITQILTPVLLMFAVAWAAFRRKFLDVKRVVMRTLVSILGHGKK